MKLDSSKKKMESCEQRKKKHAKTLKMRKVRDCKKSSEGKLRAKKRRYCGTFLSLSLSRQLTRLSRLSLTRLFLVSTAAGSGTTR
jgi:hypothetical protein